MRTGNLDVLRWRLACLESETLEGDEQADPSVFDWYGESCPCGLPPGECADHPRARLAQRPPAGDWRVWGYVAGRGAGKTHAGAAWIQDRVDRGIMRIGCLIGSTSQDVRDVLVDGPSGLLAIAPPWNRPRYLPSQRRLTWPNGARAVLLSGEEPDRARGLNIDTLWADEFAAWQRPETFQQAMLALRGGDDPRCLITTTPRNTKALRLVMDDPRTVLTHGKTYDNKHLAPQFLEQITAMFRDSRLGLQELEGELVEVADHAVFASFDPTKHVTADAEYDPRWPVHLAIDAGTSRCTGAVWLQARQIGPYRHRVNVFADYVFDHKLGAYAEAAARGIAAHNRTLPSGGRLDSVRIDPAANAETGIGPAAYGSYELVFGSRITGRWPAHRVLDGVDQVNLLLDRGDLLVHPRCVAMKDALLNHGWQARRGEPTDRPSEEHPYADLCDALRGGIRDRFPEGVRVEQPKLRAIHASRLY